MPHSPHSEARRQAIAEGQRRRWAEKRAAGQTARGPASDEARRAIAEGQRRRWEERRAAGEVAIGPMSDEARQAIGDGQRRRWDKDKAAGRRARGESYVTQCPVCGRDIKASAVRTHETRCFSTLEQFVLLYADRLEINRTTGCVTIPGRKKLPTANGRRLTRTLLEMRLGRPLAGSWEVARHRCDNPPCVNWWHLEPGTARDNSNDMMSRGRHRTQTHPDEVSARSRASTQRQWDERTPEQRAAVITKMLKTRRERHGY